MLAWLALQWLVAQCRCLLTSSHRIVDSTVIDTDRTWLLPLMRMASMAVQPHRPSLDFFQKKILDLARQCDAFGALHAATASFHRARVIDLWSLFPCFCRHPTDLEATFPALSQTLVRAMGDARYPELVVSKISNCVSGSCQQHLTCTQLVLSLEYHLWRTANPRN